MRGLTTSAVFAAVLGLGLFAPALAEAGCVCRCVDGEQRPICSSAIEVPPICPPRVCPIVPPPVAPITPPTVPPVGTVECHEAQVLNPVTGEYQFKRICR